MTDIVITEYIDPVALDRLKAEFDVHYDQDLWDKPEVIAEKLNGARALIVRNQTQVRGVILDRATDLKCVGRLGVGLDNLDMDGCAERGVDVFPAIGANADSVAELVIGGLYVMFRNAYHVSDDVIAGRWPRMQMMGREVSGKTLAIIGLGWIGKALAWRAKGVGMRVIAWDPYIDQSPAYWDELGVQRGESLTDTIKDADAISIHTPLTEETTNMFDKALISEMRKDAFLLNLARGGIVNEQDLVDALRAGDLAGAFLDSYSTEPLGADNIFADVPNLMLTPHVGARTSEADDRVCNMIADAVTECLSGT